MKTVTMLVGVPGAGKTTWLYNNSNRIRLNTLIYSTDDVIEGLASDFKMSYSEIFDKAFNLAEFVSDHRLRKSISEGNDVIFDQTNLSASKRRSRLRMFSPEYHKRAIVFPTPDPIELERRLNSRPGKIIPPHVIKSMISNFAFPTKEEGFNEIEVIKTEKEFFE